MSISLFLLRFHLPRWAEAVEQVSFFMSVANPFVALPCQIVRGGHGATNLAVLAVIMSHGKCFASIPTLAKEVGCNVKTIRKSIKYWRENAGSLGFEFTFKEGSKKHSTNTIEVYFPLMYDPDGVVPKKVGGGTYLGRGVVPKVVPQGYQVSRINKKRDLLTQDEQALGFILT